MNTNINKPNDNANQTVECVKCHSLVNVKDVQQTSKGVVCNECLKTQKKRTIIGIAAGLSLMAAVGGVYYYTSGTHGKGFDGVGDVQDSMNVVLDSTSVSFNMESATAISSPVSTQAPISDIAEFKQAMNSSISEAKNKKSGKIVIPAVSALFEINTNYLISGGDAIIKEIANAYNQTNKQSRILVEGFTCDLGGKKLNDALSKLRAETVKNILISAGVPSSSIEVKWYGKERFNEFSYSNKSDYRRVIVSIQ